MTDEQRFQKITEMLIIVRDNLFNGMSKSMQKLQARSINEILHLPNHTKSPQKKWVGLKHDDIFEALFEVDCTKPLLISKAIEAKLKEKNT